jgi:hypothetical protein
MLYVHQFIFVCFLVYTGLISIMTPNEINMVSTPTLQMGKLKFQMPF